MVKQNKNENTFLRMRRIALHLYRWLLFFLILLFIRWQHHDSLAKQNILSEMNLSLSTVQELLPNADRFGNVDSIHGGRRVLNVDGTNLGFVLQTSPHANFILGYTGPNDVLLLFDAEEKLIGIKLLHSEDTPDHVKIIQQNASFWKSFLGKSWKELSQASSADAVSGATLTSLAIQEAIVFRLRGVRPSYRFPNNVSLTVVQSIFPAATEIKAEPQNRFLMQVLAKGKENSTTKIVGYLARTSPHYDHKIGYQGPTDVLLFLDKNKNVITQKILASYDTQQYVEDIKIDWNFPKWFQEKTLRELAEIDFEQEEIDGVSGATQTSMIIAQTLKETANLILKEDANYRKKDSNPLFKMQLADWGTAIIVCIALLFAFTKLKGNRTLRILFQCALIGYLGFTNGHLISQGLLVGWAQNGIPWQLASGLAILVAVSFAVPLTSKTQIYCHHICPHGAIQELLRNRIGYKIRLSKTMRQLLTRIPLCLLILVLFAAMLNWNFDLTTIEPFDAYLFQVAGWGTIVVAIIGLIASLFIPMAYCKFGCPTGALLAYLRFRRTSDRWSHSDTTATFLLLLAIYFRSI